MTIKRDWDLVQTGSEAGDCTAPYEVRFHKNEELTVKEFVDQVLLDVREYGDIGIYDEHNYRIGGCPKICYRYGKLKGETFSDDILNSIITGASAHGGWSMMDYVLYIKKGEKKMDECTNVTGTFLDPVDTKTIKKPTDKEQFFAWLNKIIPDDFEFGHYHMTFDDDGSATIYLYNPEVTNE